MLFHLGSAGETNYPTAVASHIEMESGFEATGYIFRDERVLEAPEGCAYTTLKTGENINKGTLVSIVYPKNEETEQRLAEIETELRLLEAGEKSGQLSDITARLKSYSAGLRETIADGQPGLFLQQVPIVKGDAKSVSIAAASIIAKVTRDRLMMEYDKAMPQYHFAANKGYGSAEHIEALAVYGASPIHRRSFITHFKVKE